MVIIINSVYSCFADTALILSISDKSQSRADNFKIGFLSFYLFFKIAISVTFTNNQNIYNKHFLISSCKSVERISKESGT